MKKNHLSSKICKEFTFYVSIINYTNFRYYCCRIKFMPIEIAYYTFEGPLVSLDDIKESSGVFCILCIVANGKIFPVDVGESENIRLAISESEKKDCWIENCRGTVAVAALYTPDLAREGRENIVKRILAWDYLPCAETGTA